MISKVKFKKKEINKFYKILYKYPNLISMQIC